MKLVTCPAWSAITWKQMNGVMCLLCHSLWRLMQEQCTMGKYTFQASHSSTFCCKVQFQGSFLTCVSMFNSQGVCKKSSGNELKALREAFASWEATLVCRRQTQVRMVFTHLQDMNKTTVDTGAERNWSGCREQYFLPRVFMI